MANAKQLEILKQGVEVWNAWRNTTIEEIDLSEAELDGFNLRGAKLNDSNLSNASLKGANLVDTVCCRANLYGANLCGADFRLANFVGANLSKAKVNDANLNHTNLSSTNFAEAQLCRSTLRDAQLFDSNLDQADFSSGILTGINLQNSSLRKANLSRANLSRANLNNANLNRCNLGYANLDAAQIYGSNLSGSELSGANFNCAHIEEADFTESRIQFTVFTNVNFSSAKGLESITHYGPSSIGIDTLYLSKGKIPEVFLRGCGVPESFITQARALIGAEEGIQFYSCFISYSTQDEEFAQRLHGRLQQDQVRVWYSPHDIQGGRHMHEQIEEAIRVYDKLLILLSPDSMASSWVQTELRKARKMERRSGQRKLFPLRLVSHDVVKEWECPDGDSGEDLAVEVQKYFIPDFTQWKDHDAFEKAYKRLLKDLRANEAAKG